jgi:hypothetical protein
MRTGATGCQHPADRARPERHHLLRRCRGAVPPHRSKTGAHQRQGPGCPTPKQARAACTGDHRGATCDLPARLPGGRSVTTARSAPSRHGELITHPKGKIGDRRASVRSAARMTAWRHAQRTDYEHGRPGPPRNCPCLHASRRTSAPGGRCGRRSPAAANFDARRRAMTPCEQHLTASGRARIQWISEVA